MTAETLVMVTWLSSGHRLEVHQYAIEQPSAFAYRIRGLIYALGGESVAADFVDAGVILGEVADEVEECHPVATIDVVRIGGKLQNGERAA